MKVIHIINLDKMGGAEKIFLQFISESNLQNKIFCISNNVDPSIKQSLVGHDIQFVNKIFPFAKIKFPPFLRPVVLKKRIEREGADVLVVWDLIPRLSGKPRDVKTVYYDHGSSWVFDNNQRTREFINYIDAAIAPSKASKAMMQMRLSISVPVKIIPNTLPVPKANMRLKTPPSKHELILGTASRLAGVKGIAVSVLMVAELLKRDINARLLIAGKGPEETHLRALVKERGLEKHVSFLGYQEDLGDFYDSIHLYMSLSVAESFGLSCLDAQLHKVPCIYSVVDGQPEVNIHEVTGIGIKPTLSIQDYISQTGYPADVERKFVYDPVNNKINKPMIVSYLDGADAIEGILQKGNYLRFLEGIEQRNMILSDRNDMIKNIEDFLTQVKMK
ncbi:MULTISPECIES: glycosyltransferase [Pantoea]|jgi:glycosyltransferase involved in cell wall biosynthesis|uniref:glycosyltransferase n=1 Tax=Pantoea TaxID=53335 RepID=UPI000495FAB3|nr:MULTISPECIES: glycosyltransferase [Pantoea]MCS3403882.1 glycosyltransferase [Pantoea sp. B566]PWW11277.1 glycosyltransferase involved in cell wall biosynthesis [Pantoea sp. AG702]